MDWLWTFWEIIVNCIEIALFVFLIISQLDYPKSKKKYVFIGYIGLVVLVTILNFTGVSQLPTVLTVLAGQLVFCGHCF